MPALVRPTESVAASYLAGESALLDEEGQQAPYLNEAAANFPAFVARRRAVRRQWDVPVTELWYVDGVEYLGTLVIRHRLSVELKRYGGHIGYHVVPPHRRCGHATRMLAQALPHCRALGMRELLITCAEHNRASQRVIEANGGVHTGRVSGELHYQIDLGDTP